MFCSTDASKISSRLNRYQLGSIETRPPDSGVFNRTDYYCTALKLLDEPFYERRMLIDIDAEQTWQKKGRGRSGQSRLI